MRSRACVVLFFVLALCATGCGGPSNDRSSAPPGSGGGSGGAPGAGTGAGSGSGGGSGGAPSLPQVLFSDDFSRGFLSTTWTAINGTAVTDSALVGNPPHLIGNPPPSLEFIDGGSTAKTRSGVVAITEIQTVTSFAVSLGRAITFSADIATEGINSGNLDLILLDARFGSIADVVVAGQNVTMRIGGSNPQTVPVSSTFALTRTDPATGQTVNDFGFHRYVFHVDTQGRGTWTFDGRAIVTSTGVAGAAVSVDVSLFFEAAGYHIDNVVVGR